MHRSVPRLLFFYVFMQFNGVIAVKLQWNRGFEPLYPRPRRGAKPNSANPRILKYITIIFKGPDLRFSYLGGVEPLSHYRQD